MPGNANEPPMPQPLIELCGEAAAPLLHLAPANGFPPQTYLPLLQALPGYRSICLPPRALWGDQPPPTHYRSRHEIAADLLAGLAAHDLRDIVAIGHSLGAMVSMLALLEEPWRFRALIMLDPVFLPPPFLSMINQAWQDGSIEQFPLVQSARRRRRSFTSREDAFQRFRDKAIFADWSDEALWLYVQHGTRPRQDGQGLELVWSADWEAHYFATVNHRLWQDLPKLDGLRPTLLIRPRGSDTFPDASVAMAREMLPTADFIDLDGQSHLFPLAAPDVTAGVIRDWLAGSRAIASNSSCHRDAEAQSL